MKIQSIFFRQVVSHILVILFIALTLSGSAIYFIYTGNLIEKKAQVKQLLVNVADTFNEELKNGHIPTVREWQLARNAIGMPLWLEDADGQVLRGQMYPGYKPANRKTGEAGLQEKPQIAIAFNGLEALVITMPVPIGDRTGFIVAYSALNSNQYILERLARFYILPFIVGTIAAILLGVVLSRRLTRSIADIARAADRFSAGDYTSRTSIVGEDEIGSLGQTFNTMADSIFYTQQTRQEFFANISHELKTPLTCIKSTTEALLDGMAENDAEREHYLTRILAESNRMSRLVFDIMDSEQLESGKMKIKQERINLAVLLERQADKVKPQLVRKNVVLDLQMKAEEPYVIGDSCRIDQVLDNLISNAIRYAPPDSQIVLGLTEENQCLRIYVSDHGEGIAEEALPLIWERFYRVDKSRNRSSGGSGLGLSITRGLVEAMGGTIQVQSKKGQGTTFSIKMKKA